MTIVTRTVSVRSPGTNAGYCQTVQSNDNGVRVSVRDVHSANTVQDYTKVCMEEEYEYGVGISVGTIVDSTGFPNLQQGSSWVAITSH